MVSRWTATGLVEALRRFRRIKGFRELPKLVAALRSRELAVEKESVA